MRMKRYRKPVEAQGRPGLRQARLAIEGALTRDRGRLLGLWSRWNARQDDAAAAAAFAQAVQASVAARATRAAALPQAPVDPSLPIAAAAERIVELASYHAIIGCVASGMGIALVPQSLLDKLNVGDTVSIHALPEALAHVTTVLIRRREKISGAVAALLRILGDGSEEHA